MKRLLIFFFVSLAVLSGQEANLKKVFPKPEIEFNPQSYICLRSSNPIAVDGDISNEEWANAEWTNYFVDIEGSLKPLPRFKTRAKMLWDDNYLYIAAELEEPHLSANLKERDAVVFYDNDFEVFLNPDGTTHHYFELEMNAFNTVWDLFLIKPYRDAQKVALDGFDYKKLRSAVKLNGTINNPKDLDKGWSVEIAIPFESLKQFAPGNQSPKDNEVWRLNFSRVEWRYKTENGKYVKEINPQTNKPYPEDNWVWSPQGLIAMHYPEMWGYLIFSDKTVKDNNRNFVLSVDEKAKWALRKLYYNQQIYYLNNEKYTNCMDDLGMVNYKVDGFQWPPIIEAGTRFFEARIKSTDESKELFITQDGYVNYLKKRTW